MNSDVSESIKDRVLGFKIKIGYIRKRRTFASPLSFHARKKFQLKCLSRQYLSIDLKKFSHAHSNAHKRPQRL